MHFSFGLLWTYPVFELFRSYIKVHFTIIISAFTLIITLASFYEIIEWVIGGIFFPEQGTAFLGLQRDNWDTQKAIFLAMTGTLVTVFINAISKNQASILTI